MQSCIGLQDVLKALLLRLALDHPHHTLCQVLALSHGDLDKHGKSSATRTTALRHNVDHDKVAAATSLLQHIAQHPHRYSTRHVIWRPRTLV